METRKLSFNEMEKLQGGRSMFGCIGGSAFSVALFVAGAALATTITAGAAGVMIVGLYGGIALSCLT